MAEPGVRHVILVGPPGVGKTTVGRAVASRLGVPFIDLDERIVGVAGRPIAEIFLESGEAAFRCLEADVSMSLTGHEPAIIASGGGWAANRAAVEALAPAGKRIYMKASAPTLLGRMGAESASRPLLAGADAAARIADLLALRAAAYEASEATVDTERVDLQRVIDTIASLAAGWLAGYVAPPFRHR